MRLKKYWLWFISILIISAIFIAKNQIVENRTGDIQSLASTPTQISDPAVILFRGDNSPDCQSIHHLVSKAEQRYGNQITFRQFNWSPDNPLIEQYKVRFLPTVLLIDRNGKEVTRTVGESPTVQAKLKNRLAHLNQLLLE